MTKERAKKMYPHLKVYLHWAQVAADGLATKSQLKAKGLWTEELKPLGVFASRVSKDAHYLLYPSES